MNYYRLAIQEGQSSTWTWKSTPLTSLAAVLQLLRVYSFIPQDRIRVFTSSSKEELNELLSRENNNLVSGSVTASRFLRDRHIRAGESVQSVATTICAEKTAPGSSDESGLSFLDKKRLEIERGPGGDHDTPYTFSLPISTPQLLVLARWQAKVQAGEFLS